jgi:deazaflavin-dependent oxidoreductase (nitroreductase family)
MLTTTGRRTGQSRCQPLLYTLDGNGYVVVATNWGFPTHPGWSANLLANPAAIIEVRGRRIPVRAVLAEGSERERLWQLVTPGWRAYQTYAAAAERTMRVFLLVPLLRNRGEMLFGYYLAKLGQRILAAYDTRQADTRQADNQRRAAAGLPPRTRKRRRTTLAQLAVPP